MYTLLKSPKLSLRTYMYMFSCISSAHVWQVIYFYLHIHRDLCSYVDYRSVVVCSRCTKGITAITNCTICIWIQLAYLQLYNRMQQKQ